MIQPRQQRVTAQLKDLKQMIDRAPARMLPELVVCIVKNCVRKNAFPSRKLAGVVHTLESQLRTGAKPSISKKLGL